MVFAVANIERAILVDEHPVGAGQLAPAGHAIRAIAFFAVTHHHLNPAGPRVYHADAMAFSVGNVDLPTGGNRETLGPRQLGVFGGTTITRETGFAGAGHVMQQAFLKIHPVEGIGIAQGQPKLASVIKSNGARTAQWRGGGKRRAIGRSGFLPGAANRLHDSGLRIPGADPLIAQITYVEQTVRPEGLTDRILELRLAAQAAITANVPVQALALRFVDKRSGQISQAPRYIDDDSLRCMSTDGAGALLVTPSLTVSDAT